MTKLPKGAAVCSLVGSSSFSLLVFIFRLRPASYACFEVIAPSSALSPFFLFFSLICLMLAFPFASAPPAKILVILSVPPLQAPTGMPNSRLILAAPCVWTCALFLCNILHCSCVVLLFFFGAIPGAVCPAGPARRPREGGDVAGLHDEQRHALVVLRGCHYPDLEHRHKRVRAHYHK